MLHIVIHIQFAIIPRFHLVTGHRFKVQFNARCVKFFSDVPMQGPFKRWVNVQVANLNKGVFNWQQAVTIRITLNVFNGWQRAYIPNYTHQFRRIFITHLLLCSIMQLVKYYV